METPLDQLYPVRAGHAWAEEDGRIVVLLPKRMGPLARWVRGLTHGPAHLRVALDETGSRAFCLADGQRTALALADELVAELGERGGPRERALQYLATLARNDLVHLARAPLAPPAGAPPPRQVPCPACARGFHTADAAGTRLRCPACGRAFRA